MNGLVICLMINLPSNNKKSAPTLKTEDLLLFLDGVQSKSKVFVVLGRRDIQLCAIVEYRQRVRG